MANIGFISTSVLESKDGIDFNEEKRKESDEVLEAERIAKEAEKKPLWEQLAGKRDEKQAKFDAVRAAIFAPPRALDDEESTFLQGVEAQRLEAKERKEKWEAEELRGFALARANQTVTIAEPKKPKPKPPQAGGQGAGSREQQEAKAAPPVAIKIKAKRKHKDKDERRSKKSQKGSRSSSSRSSSTKEHIATSSGSNEVAEDVSADHSRLSNPGKGEGANSGAGGGEKGADEGLRGRSKAETAGAKIKGLSSLLGAYGSDSDSSDGGDEA